ncbi:ELMO domain-containing protein 2 [Hippocampus comes]|uniref:ELMO/CED-12 domain containing 2 n=1 Tax=Hippocampus comes TaxID=109280 RepID=A0A3Q2XHH1_HIPCM|nr:PREDICTED: ELMO domain-containing protein 2 [Hippocampus comes]XP_019717651.1 PREDICTED: ELMO domain-containing protein 2 [Hippocampus comes]
MLVYIWQYVYTTFLRYWFKWLIRQATGTCELQRICSGYGPGASRTINTEYSLKSSKSKLLRGAVESSEEHLGQHVQQIMKEKNIKEQTNPRFKESLHTSLLQITGYESLYASVEDVRKEAFCPENTQHEAMLLELWELLMPSVTLESRVTKQWGDIGFQGDDPKTDFRGMGVLGLTNLLFFSEHYTQEARLVLSHANHPKLGYSYAIVGINLTEMAYSLLKSGALKAHFYNTVPGAPKLQHFHQLYCYLAFEFDKFWLAEEPESIMLFNQYRDKFHHVVRTLLENPRVSLTLSAPS